MHLCLIILKIMRLQNTEKNDNYDGNIRSTKCLNFTHVIRTNVSCLLYGISFIDGRINTERSDGSATFEF